MKKFLAIGVLRVLTGMSQFAVVLFITAILSLGDLGHYSVFTIVLGYFSQFAGFAFYTYVLRELGKHDRSAWPRLLQQQWLFMGVGIIISSAVGIVLDALGLISLAGGIIFPSLLILSVFNNQHENFLVGAGYPVSAAINLLIRNTWIYFLLVIDFIRPDSINFRSVLMAWAVAEFFAAFFVLFFLNQKGMLPKQRYSIDLPWIFSGIKVGARYTLLGLLFSITVSIQRLVLEQYQGEEAVGVFHFFYVISVFVPNLLEATLFAVILPKIIASYQLSPKSTLQFPHFTSFVVLIGLGVTALISVYFLLPFGLSFLGKPELLESRHIFLFTAVYAILYTTSRIFHYDLYSSGNDYWLIKANFMACLLASLTSFALVPVYGIVGAAASLIIVGIFFLILLILPFVNSTRTQHV